MRPKVLTTAYKTQIISDPPHKFSNFISYHSPTNYDPVNTRTPEQSSNIKSTTHISLQSYFPLPRRYSIKVFTCVSPSHPKFLCSNQTLAEKVSLTITYKIMSYPHNFISLTFLHSIHHYVTYIICLSSFSLLWNMSLRTAETVSVVCIAVSQSWDSSWYMVDA